MVFTKEGRTKNDTTSNYIKQVAIEKDIDSVRLDCNYQRTKLRALYERAGFVYAGKKELSNGCEMALYVWKKA